MGATEVDVRMDSKLVVEQMSGRWQVKHPDLKELIKQAMAAATKFDRISYAWIPRAENSHADRLANEAMDAAAELEKPQAGELEETATLRRHRPRPQAGPAPAALPPDFCCSGTGRPSYPRSGGIPAAGTRR